MTIEANKTLVRRFFEEAINGRSPDLGEELFDAEYLDHNPIPGQPPGKKAARFIVEHLVRVSGGAPQVTVDEMVAEGDLVAVRWHARGVEALVLLRVVGGKVRERWAAFNRHDVAR